MLKLPPDPVAPLIMVLFEETGKPEEALGTRVEVAFEMLLLTAQVLLEMRRALTAVPSL